MAVKVRIPTPLQKLTNNQGEVQCEAKDVNELLAGLEIKDAQWLILEFRFGDRVASIG